MGIMNHVNLAVGLALSLTVLGVCAADALPDGAVRIAAAHASTCALEGLCGPIEVAGA